MVADGDAGAHQPSSLCRLSGHLPHNHEPPPPYPSRFMQGPVSNTKMCRSALSCARQRVGVGIVHRGKGVCFLK